MQHYVDKYAQCPFYSQQDKLKLHCEGFCRNNSIHLVFNTRTDMDEHKRLYCNNIRNYAKCPLYPVISKQYEDR